MLLQKQPTLQDVRQPSDKASPSNKPLFYGRIQNLKFTIKNLFGFYFEFSCRRDMKASVATAAGLSAQRSILSAIAYTVSCIRIVVYLFLMRIDCTRRAL